MTVPPPPKVLAMPSATDGAVAQNAPAPQSGCPGPDVQIVPRQRLRLGPDCRLRTRAQLQWVRERGVKDAARLCVVSAVQPPPDDARRVAFVVSRRYSPKAVVRNRARRLLREAYRQAYPALRPAWLVLIPRVRLQRARMQDVLSDLRAACGRLGLLPEGTGPG